MYVIQPACIGSYCDTLFSLIPLSTNLSTLPKLLTCLQCLHFGVCCFCFLYIKQESYEQSKWAFKLTIFTQKVVIEEWPFGPANWCGGNAFVKEKMADVKTKLICAEHNKHELSTLTQIHKSYLTWHHCTDP